MLNFKNEMAKIISKITNIDVNELEGYIEIPPDENMGDYAFPCFKLAKELRKAPPVIANELKEKIEVENEILDKVEVVGGYLNFYINKNSLIKNTIEEVDSKGEEYGKAQIGKGKNVVIDYSHPNIAKPFHIGHYVQLLLDKHYIIYIHILDMM